MNALEKFVSDMKKLEEISLLENEQQKQEQQNQKLTDDEQRRIGLIIPPLTGKFPRKMNSIFKKKNSILYRYTKKI